ncbi:MAG: Methyl-accepting chemotaxis protein [Acidimicrobiales bacterium]|nr:Methyl-accepting chemotaxis protein [Acidimicrobiales bacterium]
MADVVVTAAFAAVAVLLGAHAGWPPILLGGLVLAAGPGDSVPLRLVGLAVAVGVLVLDRRGRVEPSAGAVLALAVVQGAVRLPTTGHLGTSAALAALATLPLVVAGTRRLPPVLRSKVAVGAAVIAAVVLAASGSALLATARARTALEAAERDIDAGIAAARRGDTDGATRSFRSAAIGFSAAQASTGAWWTTPAHQVPLVAQHLGVLDEVARLGGRGADLAVAGSTEIDVDRLRLVDGRIDPAAVRAYQPTFHRLQRQASEIRRQAARLGSPWLVQPVRERLDRFEQSVAKAAAGARTAEQAADLAPYLLGQGGHRTYLLAFVTPAEARASGGFFGNYGVLDVDDGRLHLVRIGRDDQLDAAGDPAKKRITGPPDFVARYSRFDPAHTWANITMSPDFPSVGRAMAELFPESGGVPVDGVIRIDPVAMAGLLALTGPVDLPGLPYRLTDENVTQFLVADQYVAFDDQAERSDLLGDIARAAFDHLTAGEAATPAQFGADLGPALADGNLALWFRDPKAQAFATRIGADDALPPHRGDLFGVTTQNASGNKIESFLQRTIRYRTDIDARRGVATTHVSVNLRNDAPPGGFPDYVTGNLVGLPKGTNRSYVSFFSSQPVRSATIDGKPLALERDAEGGYPVASAFLDLPPQSTRTIELVLQGPVDIRTGRYRFDYLPQVMVRPDRVDWWITTGAGGRVEGPAHVRREPSVGPWSVTVGIDRVSS